MNRFRFGRTQARVPKFGDLGQHRTGRHTQRDGRV